ncbi:MAG TPA: hypothetical protein VGG33_10180, partial [Polyangia bacterium]
MRHTRALRVWVLVGVAASAALIAGCEERRFDASVLPGQDGAAGNAGDGGQDAPAPAYDLSLPPADSPVIPGGADGGDGPGACVPLACMMAGGQYCGTIGNGCGGTLECGACPAGEVCGGGGTANVCAKTDPNCVPITCAQTGGKYCGKIGNGCGGTLDCGDCAAGQTCGANSPQVCGVADANCKPITCAQTGGRYCGKVGDGCGKELDCGECIAGTTCGGAGTPNVCGKPVDTTCVPLTCTPAGGKFCGVIGDGCGKTIDCGACDPGTTCGGAGTPGVCDKAPPPNCDPLVCQQPGGKYCGLVGDGCNKTIDCGGCPAGQTCGGGGTPGLCGAPGPAVCQPVTCQQPGGQYCGSIGDGCGKTIDCGACPSGDTCGGGGIANVCGRPGNTCQPITCAQTNGQYCGKIGDGCGKTIDCGACPAGEICGAGGVSGVCAKPVGSCQQLACVQAGGQYCGVVGDGCGKSIDCGACPAGQTCGGGGTPGVCGTATACTPLSCTQATGKYCGKVGDGCGKTVDCGGCAAGQTCGGGGVAGVCGAPPPAGCTPQTCQASATAQYCGTIGDGCGGSLTCAACPAGQTCGGGGITGLCGSPPPAGCVPLGCSNGAVQYCGGTIGDGCGSGISCTSTCPAGQSCGGGGVANVCGAPPPAGCVALTSCTNNGAQFCGGVIGNGCGGSLDCSAACPAGQTCGGGGVAGVCGAPAPAGCVALTSCTNNGVQFCGGAVGNNCGGSLDCSAACPAGQTCGGGGVAGVCGAPPPAGCVALTSCTNSGVQFCGGTIGNGCGGSLDCSGACPAGQSCGGGGVAGVCGAPPPAGCVPAVCRPSTGGQYCGTIGDGCGGTLNCGACDAGNTCAGNGVPNVCFPDSCVNLCRQQVTCPSNGDTTVTGIVRAATPAQYGPADPIYNALVYVPNTTVEPFPAGVSCDRCGVPASGSPLVSALTGADGSFTLRNVPAGTNIPLVIQVGRWRRQITIPTVTACSSLALTAEQTRLPRNKTEGDIPLTAVATGNVDSLECVLRKMGVADSEFTRPSGTGRIHLYRTNGADAPDGSRTSYTTLVDSPTNLAKYDMVVFPCEGGENDKSTTRKQNVINYANAGGRLFFTHYSYVWMYDIAPFNATADWDPDTVDVDPRPMNPLPTLVDQTFPKGVAFAQWLQNVGASTTLGNISIDEP